MNFFHTGLLLFLVARAVSGREWRRGEEKLNVRYHGSYRETRNWWSGLKTGLAACKTLGMPSKQASLGRQSLHRNNSPSAAPTTMRRGGKGSQTQN